MGRTRIALEGNDLPLFSGAVDDCLRALESPAGERPHIFE